MRIYKEVVELETKIHMGFAWLGVLVYGDRLYPHRRQDSWIECKEEGLHEVSLKNLTPLQSLFTLCSWSWSWPIDKLASSPYESCDQSKKHIEQIEEI